MPKIKRKSDRSLRLPQLHVLRALADGGTLRLAEIGTAAGLNGVASGTECAALTAAGLIDRNVIEIEGVAETSYSITGAGLAALEAANVGELVKPLARVNVKKSGPKALIPIFGGNRLCASVVGEALGKLKWAGVPFAGGLSELSYIDAMTGAANDAHGAIMNLAAVAACPTQGPALWRRLRRAPLHRTWLKEAQQRCAEREESGPGYDGEIAPDLDWAADYFACSWMARSGSAGTDGEFGGSFSLRWSATGGDSVVRFVNAAKGLREWRKILAAWTFESLDAFAFLDKCKDVPGYGIYCDPPFPGPGAAYKHKFSDDEHRKLAAVLARFGKTRVVCRFYDMPLIRGLYLEGVWKWRRLAGRKQTNAIAPEVLIVKN